MAVPALRSVFGTVVSRRVPARSSVGLILTADGRLQPPAATTMLVRVERIFGIMGSGEFKGVSEFVGGFCMLVVLVVAAIFVIVDRMKRSFSISIIDRL